MNNADVNIGLIRTYLAVLSEGGLKGAARQLNLTPSAVSMQLKRLEEQIGKRLLDRNSQGITLTEAGRTMRQHGEKVIAAHSNLMSEIFAHEPRGHISLGIPTDHARMLLNQLLPIFESEFPALEPRLILEPSRQLRRRVAASELDIAIAAREPGSPDGRLLWSEDLVWCGDAENSDGSLRVGLLSVDCVLRDTVRNQLERLPRPHDVVLEASSVAALEAAVEANFAMSLLPASSFSARVRATRNAELISSDGGRLEFAFVASSKISDDRQIRIFQRLRERLALPAD